MKTLSFIIPIYNEERNIPRVYTALKQVLGTLPYQHELIFVNDGSRDKSSSVVEDIMTQDLSVRLIEFSRNFGKEAATTAGYHHAQGDAVMCIDADLQHPPSYIPEFIQKWENGADVVVGVRNNNATDARIKHYGSNLYYLIIRRISQTDIIPRATDFRLTDRTVVDHFNALTEHNRMTRGLIDWLGFTRELVYFDVPGRIDGDEARYSFWKLFKLALESFISHSLFPLKLAGYFGIFMLFTSFSVLILMAMDALVGFGLAFSKTAILITLVLFLVSIVLISIGLLAFYIGHIYHDVQDRPLYIVRKRK